ncbi:hypothetical protein H5410_001654 [Solanum commersonii]|uniref:Uncharacterized protein n=1 Tax=Solanum commersonii TaxID=4109 RepID=A0A9J6AZT0_SOLCO|nr:hypothetical protein H5410_001654 [Solanum commersonii]
MNTFINNNNKFNKKKVVFIMGVKGTGKSRLSIDLPTHLRGDIINSDKIQIYKGLDNKVILFHNFLGEIELDFDFTTEDFCLKFIVYIEFFLRLNVFQLLLEGQISILKNLWKTMCSCSNIKQSVLNCRIDTRVDEIVNAGMVDEVR